MIYVIAAPVNKLLIKGAVDETGGLVSHFICEEELYLGKYVVENFGSLKVEDIVIDLQCLMDTDEEIVKAIDSIRYSYDTTRITILAAGRKPGNKLLLSLANLGINNIISTDDNVEIKEELKICLTKGKTYKDTTQYRELKEDANINVVIEKKQVVDKVQITIAGAQKRIGTTHAAIVLANHLRNRKYSVALVEYNRSGAFDSIRRAYEIPLMEESYFILDGIDYYPDGNETILANVLAKTYNYIIVDFGCYAEIPKGETVTFHKGEIRFIVAGTKAWEEMALAKDIFANFSTDSLKKFHYLFNFTPKNMERFIIDNMAEIYENNVHFMPYSDDPLTSREFPDIDSIFERFLPERPEKKKGLFGRKRK